MNQVNSRESSAPTREEIARDATWLAQALDPTQGMVRLVAMNRNSYRAASFLDDRMLEQPVDAQVVPWPEIEAAMSSGLGSDARWIFHIGHVGSTLLSRLLGELPHVLALREPRLLRDLALSPEAIRRTYLGPVPKLMSRTFAAQEIACVKATSFVSEIAAQVVPAGERALFMVATPRNYIASILAGENSVKELHALAPSRVQRVASRVGLPAPRNDAELAAAAWACETTALELAAEEMTDRPVEWADFDAMLGDLQAALERVVGFFGFFASTEQVKKVAESPLISRYSKALEYDYSAGLRRDLIAEAYGQSRNAIDGALAMLRAAAEKSPLLARALARGEEN